MGPEPTFSFFRDRPSCTLTAFNGVWKVRGSACLPKLSTLSWLFRPAALLEELDALEVDVGAGGEDEGALGSSSCTSNRSRLPRSATDP